jgi:hypothetical protein
MNRLPAFITTTKLHVDDLSYDIEPDPDAKAILRCMRRAGFPHGTAARFFVNDEYSIQTTTTLNPQLVHLLDLVSDVDLMVDLFDLTKSKARDIINEHHSR